MVISVNRHTVKYWVSHILFLRKRALIVYLAALKKGAIQAAHPYYYKGSYPPIVIKPYLPKSGSPSK